MYQFLPFLSIHELINKICLNKFINKGLRRTKYDTTACWQGKVEQVHINSKCGHCILFDNNVLDTVICWTHCILFDNNVLDTVICWSHCILFVDNNVLDTVICWTHCILFDDNNVLDTVICWTHCILYDDNNVLDTVICWTHCIFGHLSCFTISNVKYAFKICKISESGPF
jgi:hypothetical protein